MGKKVYFSSPTTNVLRWLIQNNKSVLLTFYDPKQHATFCQLAQEVGGYKGDVMMDSGAFSARKGKPIDVNKYIAFINQRPKYVRFFVSVDLIQHDVNVAHLTMEQKCQVSLDNFEKILKGVWCPERIAPVYHFGEPQWVLDAYLALCRQYGSKYICFGLGSNMSGKNSNPGREPRQYAQRICARIREAIPDMWIHLLGYNHPKDLPYIDCNSSDSTGYAVSARYGHLICQYGDLAITDLTKKSASHPHFTKKWGDVTEATLKKYVEGRGWDYEALKNGTDERACFNAQYIDEEISGSHGPPTPVRTNLFET